MLAAIAEPEIAADWLHLIGLPMSALGQKQKLQYVRVMACLSE
jgi:hypothetical protein